MAEELSDALERCTVLQEQFRSSEDTLSSAAAEMEQSLRSQLLASEEALLRANQAAVSHAQVHPTFLVSNLKPNVFLDTLIVKLLTYYREMRCRVQLRKQNSFCTPSSLHLKKRYYVLTRLLSLTLRCTQHFWFQI